MAYRFLLFLYSLMHSCPIFVGGHTWVNPSKRLVDIALDRWNSFKLRADNTSIVTVMLDPPGPPRAQVLRRLYGIQSPTVHTEPQLAKQKDIKAKLNGTQENVSTQYTNKNSAVDFTKETDKPTISKNEDSCDKCTENCSEATSSTVEHTSKENAVEDKDDAGGVAIISR